MKVKLGQVYVFLDDIHVNAWDKNIGWSITVFIVGELSVNKKPLVRRKVFVYVLDSIQNVALSSERYSTESLL